MQMPLPSTRTRRRGQTVVGLTAMLGLLGAVPALSAVDTARTSATLQAAASVPTAVPDDVTLLQVSKSLLGKHTWYRQTADGYPVVDGLYAVHAVTSGPRAGAVTVWDGRVPVGELGATAANVTSATASEAAVAYTGGHVLTQSAPALWVLARAETRLVWAVTTVTSGEVGESHVSYVDALTGEVLESFVESKSATPDRDYTRGNADVFDANPVMKLLDQDLTDQNDSDDAVPPEAYTRRDLGHLDSSHTLVGRWAQVVNVDLASSPDDNYFYERSAEEFEQVMAYYALDREQAFYQRLGFGDINAEPQNIETNTIPDDNSFYSPSQDLIVMGAGGVDDAEDPEVTWHEAGHATQDDQVPGFGGGGEAGAIGEGFGDYIAVTMSQRHTDETDEAPWSCVMDWDATSYDPGPIHCLRSTDTDKMYPEDLTGEVHADGEIWSAALWDMNLAMGRQDATRAILEGQFSFTPSATMSEAAEAIVQAATDLYGEDAGAQAQAAFEDRGIL
jgi:Zn-dependent metalloprotease